MTRSTRWDELQNRWASGEALSPSEERERQELAAGDPLARRELELFAELRRRLDAPAIEGTDQLVAQALESARGRPRLRVVPPSGAPPQAKRSWTPRRAGAAVAAAALASLAAGLAFYFRGESPSAPPPGAIAPAPSIARSELVLASGAVELEERSARVGGGPLAVGDRVKTGHGRACLTIDPGIDVCVGPESEVRLESLNAAEIRVQVERGTALAALTRREPGRSFALVAGEVSATARGTVFALQRDRDGASVELVVMEGAVDVARSGGAAESVPAHSRWRLRGGVERGTIGRGEEAALWALAAPRELWAGPDVGVLEIRGREPGLEVAIDQEAPLPLPLRAFVPAGKRRLVLRGAGESEIVASVDVVAGKTREIELPELAPAPARSQEPTPPASAAVLLKAARRELELGNARAALGVYERLRATFPASAEARTVLVTMGKLELDLKRPARALGHFDAYLAARGPLAPEALAGKINALRALGRSAEERAAIEQYLARHPNGFEAPALRKRLETLRRP